jgi:peptide chain release factor 1
MVLPEAEEFDVQIDMNDVVDFFCSSGPGGQSVNTTKSAVRLTHSNRFSGSMSGSKITT